MITNPFDKLFEVVSVPSYVDIFNLKLKASDLRNPAVLGRVRMLIRENLAPSDAQEVLDCLNPLLNGDSTLIDEEPKLYSGWQQVVTYLHFIALPFIQNSDELEHLFKNNLLFALRENIDVQAIVDLSLTILRDEFSGGSLRQVLLNALRGNEEKLGKRVASLQITGKDSIVSAVIKNWLLDYELMEGKGNEPRDALQHSHYMTKSKNVSLLDDEERSLLMKVIKLDDYLRFTPALLPSDKLIIEGKLSEAASHSSPLVDIESPVLPLAVPPISPSSSIVSVRRSTVRQSISAVPPSVPVMLPRPELPVVSPLPVPTVPVVGILPEPQVFKQTLPALVFDIEDEREADRFRDQLANGKWQMANGLEKQLRALADDVIVQHKFSFKYDGNKRRFVNLFVSFLKDVRNPAEVREVLLKSVESGGLGLTSDKAEQVVGIVESVKRDWEFRIKNLESGSGKPELGINNYESGIENKEQLEARSRKPEAVSQKPVQPLDRLLQSDIAPFLIKEQGGKSLERSLISPVASAPVPPPPQATPQAAGPIVPSSEVRSPFDFNAIPKEHRAESPVKSAIADHGAGIEQGANSKEQDSSLSPKLNAGVAAPTLPGGFSPEKVQQWRQEMLKEIARVAPPVVITEHRAGSIEQGAALGSTLKASASAPTDLRPRLADVKASPRTVGPVGELKSLGLVDFRRLGGVVQALAKVRAKIDLLGETSVTKRLEAVRAWQASPVYQAYLRLGRDSIERGSTVADTAAALDAAGQPTLTEAEFNAIADFNMKLRF